MAVIRKAGTRLLTGVEELDAKLSALSIGAANKIARPALTKAARYLLKRIKAKVPPDMKSAKRAFGMTVDAKGGRSRNQQRAKVGAGVGKVTKTKRKGDRTNPGVGIAKQNIHWFILGTGPRETGSVARRAKGVAYRKSTGRAVHSTGTMPPQMAGIVKNTTAAERAEMLGIMRTAVTDGLSALARKTK